jgi:hypothetical protein
MGSNTNGKRKYGLKTPNSAEVISENLRDDEDNDGLDRKNECSPLKIEDVMISPHHERDGDQKIDN